MATGSGVVATERVENVAWVFRGHAFQARVTDKAIERITDGKTTVKLVVLRGLRLQKLDPVPDTDLLGKVFTADVTAIIEAVQLTLDTNARHQ